MKERREQNAAYFVDGGVVEADVEVGEGVGGANLGSHGDITAVGVLELDGTCSEPFPELDKLSHGLEEVHIEYGVGFVPEILILDPQLLLPVLFHFLHRTHRVPSIVRARPELHVEYFR
jgi:hypothetical protein